MKKHLKPIIAASIVIVGAVFFKMGSNADVWRILIGSLGCIVVVLPAFLWYKDKINM